MPPLWQLQPANSGSIVVGKSQSAGAPEVSEVTGPLAFVGSLLVEVVSGPVVVVPSEPALALALEVAPDALDVEPQPPELELEPPPSES
jgi:hypothetical protein